MAKNTHLQKTVERRVAAHREDIEREKRTYGEVRPPEAQLGSRTWKSYSRARFASSAFRAGFEQINWT